MPVNFCEAGANCALAMLRYLGKDLFMVGEVKEELERKADGSPALRRFLETIPDEQVRTLDLELAAQVAMAKSALNAAGAHSRENLGEVASVFYAAQRRQEGEDFAVITDDGDGKRLARDRGLDVVTTPNLVVEMVCAGAIGYADGARVWRGCFTNPQRWKGFRRQVERDCPQRVAA